MTSPRMRLVLPETASTRYFEILRSIGPSENLTRAIGVAEQVHVVTDAERVALYGTCATCGSPVDCFDLEFRDGDRLDMLLCLEHPMEHSA